MGWGRRGARALRQDGTAQRWLRGQRRGTCPRFSANWTRMGSIITLLLLMLLVILLLLLLLLLLY